MNTNKFSRPSRSSLTSSVSIVNAVEHRFLSNIYSRMPTIIQTLAHLCQLLDDYPLSEVHIEHVQQGTMDCILWNDKKTYPIAIDQNRYLTDFRQLIRRFVHEFLEFAQQIRLIDHHNEQISSMIDKSRTYLQTLKEYRSSRQSTSDQTFDDTMFILINLDRQQYHQLRVIALHLRQSFLRLIQLIRPRFSSIMSRA